MTDNDVERPVNTARYKLCLFITGNTACSARAIEDMRKICDESLAGQYDIEIIDVYDDPEATKKLQIIAEHLAVTSGTFSTARDVATESRFADREGLLGVEGAR